MKILFLTLTVLFSIALAAGSHAAVSDQQQSQLPAPTAAPADVPANAYRILFIGNSITRHGTNADVLAKLGWDHVSGMAASEENKDYMHLLTAKIAAALPNRDAVIQVAGSVADKGTAAERIAPVIKTIESAKPDLVIFQHGEHEQPAEGQALLADTYNALLDYLQSMPSKPAIVCVGVWAQEFNADRSDYSGWCGVVEHTMRDICALRHIPYVSVVSIAADPACHGTGTVPGVRWHPNDAGHARYADAIFATVRPLLPGGGNSLASR